KSRGAGTKARCARWPAAPTGGWRPGDRTAPSTCWMRPTASGYTSSVVATSSRAWRLAPTAGRWPRAWAMARSRSCASGPCRPNKYPKKSWRDWARKGGLSYESWFPPLKRGEWARLQETLVVDLHAPREQPATRRRVLEGSRREGEAAPPFQLGRT